MAGRAVLRAASGGMWWLVRAWRRARMLAQRPLFRSFGRRFVFDPDGLYTFTHVEVGDDVNLGYRPTLQAGPATIRIGSNVFFGPYVTVVAGNHNTAEVGRFMADVTAKRPGDDLGVVIQDDVWVGARAIILHGVTVGRGSIVGAGAIVTHDVAPYSIVVGSPARLLRFRWDVDTVMRHEESLYAPDARLTRAQLEAHRAAPCAQTAARGS